jgi:hypothetical protein
VVFKSETSLNLSSLNLRFTVSENKCSPQSEETIESNKTVRWYVFSESIPSHVSISSLGPGY